MEAGVRSSVASLAQAYAETLDSRQRADVFQPYPTVTAANRSHLPQGCLGRAIAAGWSGRRPCCSPSHPHAVWRVRLSDYGGSAFDAQDSF